ncbi:MAG: DUF4838 domain-containing protein [Phycisphaerales bacterium]|nr:DUF4838 domain-containing protein [Phycisphaerales bacterium]
MHTHHNPRRAWANACFTNFFMVLFVLLVAGGCPVSESLIPTSADPAQDSQIVDGNENGENDEQVLAYSGIYPLTDSRGWPSNLTVTRLTDRQILLGWQDNSADEEGFRIERQESGGQWQSLATVGRNQTSYIDESVESDTTYSYRIIAFNTNDESTPSIVASLISETEIQNLPPTLLPVIDLQVKQVTESSIQLAWSDANDQEEGTLIERSDGTNDWHERAVLESDLTTFSDTDLQAAMTYCYRVTPFRASEYASTSESVCLTLEGPTGTDYAFLGGGGGGGGGSSPQPSRPPFLVVEDGQPVACIVIPPSCPTIQYKAALLLQDYIYRSTDAFLPISRDVDSAPAIHVGRNSYVDQLPLSLETLEDEGFVLGGVDAANYVITGWTAQGTEYGVNEFLERHVGVRWLMPGEIGTHVPQLAGLEVSSDEVRQTPAFISRWFSGFQGTVQWQWAYRNRMQTAPTFFSHHNMKNLLPPSRYIDTHPHFYPVINGERYLPPNDTVYDWQPVFTAEGIIDEVVQSVIDHFQAYPQRQSCSLGINDSHRYDDVLFQGSAGTNFLGFPNLSNSYYNFCNRVAYQVLLAGVDKYFGCLAYSHVAAPPIGFQLHPRIVPFMTYDRMKWCNPEIRAQGQQITLAWNAAADRIGWYDYLYGAAYCIPRVYPHLMQEYLHFGHANGVRAAYAEAYPFWGEGPKLYIYLKLLWDPSQDVDVLLDDWYIHCVGEQAAPYLREYYAIWERFWTQEAPHLEWFGMGQQFLRFMRIDYLKGVDPADMIRSRQLLDACVTHAQTSDQQARAELLRRAFGYYEATYEAYRPEVIAQCEPIIDESSALAAVEVLQNAPVANIRRFQLWDEFLEDEVLRPGIDLYEDRYRELTRNTWGVSLPWRLLDHAQTSPEVYNALKNFQLPALDDPENPPFGYPSEELSANVQSLLAFIDRPKTLCTVDSSFENGIENQTPLFNAPWLTWPRGDDAHPQFRVTSEVIASTGTKSVKILGAPGYSASVYQVVSEMDYLPPGRYVAAMRFHTPTTLIQQGQDPPPTVRISVIAYANYGQSNQVQRSYATEMVVPAAHGGWNTISWNGEIDDTIDHYPVSHMWVMASVRYLNDQIIYLDDVYLEKLSE